METRRSLLVATVSAMILPAPGLALEAFPPSSAPPNNSFHHPTGRVVAGGARNFGQTLAPPDLTGVIAIDAGIWHSIALRSDGTVTAFGDNSEGQTDMLSGLTNVIAVAAGDQLELPVNWTSVRAITCGSDYVVGLKTDRSVVVWAFSQFGSYFGQTNVPANATNVAIISAGRWHNLALRMDGVLVGWGGCESGECSTPEGLTNLVALSGGSAHSVAPVTDRAPWLVAGPTDQSAYTGTTAEFGVLVAGAVPLSLQWQLQGANLPDATGARLVFSNVQYGDAGSYRVVASNAFGSLTSSPAALTVVGAAPFIVRQPVAPSVLPSGQAEFEVVADGSRPMWFQWQFAGVAIPGATNATLLLSNLVPSHAGNYTAVVTNFFGSVTSAVAALNLLPVHTVPARSTSPSISPPTEPWPASNRTPSRRR